MTSRLRLLTIAPTTSHPPMIGDAKRIHRLSRGFLRSGTDNVYVGKNFVYRGDTQVEQVASQQFREWPRSVSGLLSIMRRGHYNEVKHCTRRWLNFVRPYLEDDSFNAVYCHFIFTYPLVRSLIGERPFVIDTHNSEWEWYDSFEKSSSNPLIKQVCRHSRRRADEIMGQLPADTIMAHVSESDAAAYRAVRPDLMHLVVPNGGDVEPRLTTPDYSAQKKTLLFFASLHGKMSYDALRHLADKYWPAFRNEAHVLVAGAHPSAAIQALCREQHWELRANLTEAEVTDVFNSAHFSVMPFTYGAGSKLKFFDACLRGVPVLSTTAGACGQQNLPEFVTVSDDPSVWRDRLTNTSQLDDSWRDQVAAFGQEFNWTSIAKRVIGPLEDRLQVSR